MSLLSFVTLDVFTSTPCRGNPLAIVRVPRGAALAQAQKQLIAREFNLSETVFLHEQDDADRAARQARIDIFTPWAEIPFAGHPTVGTSNFLLHPELGLKDTVEADALLAKAGRLPFRRHPRGAQLEVAHNVRIHANQFVSSDAGFEGVEHPVVSIVKGMTFVLARLPDLAALGDRPVRTGNLVGAANAYTSQGRMDEGWREGLLATYFWVDMGLENDGDEGEGGQVRRLRTRTMSAREDPATGSAASALCSWITLTEGGKDGGSLVRKYHLTQGVEMGRQSEIHVRVTLKADRSGVEEVLISGGAVQVMRGEVNVPPMPGA